MLPEPEELVGFLSPYEPEIQERWRACRRKLIEILPPVVEFLYDATQTVTTGFGFTEKSSEHFVFLPIYPRWVTFGFPWGVNLVDSEGRLRGSGTRVRHMRLASPDDLDDPYLRDLLNQAMAMAPRPVEAVTPHTVVKVMAGPKRRPGPK